MDTNSTGCIEVTSKTDFIRKLKQASGVAVNHGRFPELNGVRKIIKSQTNGFCIELPESHPRYVGETGSWTYLDQEDQSFSVQNGALVITQIHPVTEQPIQSLYALIA